MIDGALFVLLGALETRYSTQPDRRYGGLAAKLPRTATLFVITSLAMIGLPMLNGFVGEFLILSSTFTGVSRGWAIVATMGVILGAAYMLWLVQRLFYGPESQMASGAAGDRFALRRTGDAVWPLAVLMLVMGVAPSFWLRAIESRAVRRSASEMIDATCRAPRNRCDSVASGGQR